MTERDGIERGRDGEAVLAPVSGHEHRKAAGAPRRRWAGWGPVALAASAALAGSFALFALHGQADDGARYAGVETAATQTAPAHDPLMAALIRCRDLAPGVDDSGCRAAWDENRLRFFGEARAMRVPADPMPAYAPIPAPSTANQTPPASPAPAETNPER